MTAPWISLLLGAVALLLLTYAWTRYARVAAKAAYVDDLETLAQLRANELASMVRLSTALAGAIEIDSLKQVLATELPPLVGSDDFWIVARLNGLTLLAGEPVEPGSAVPRALVTKADAWECFPLQAAEKTVGMVGVKQQPGGFTDDQRATLTAVATLLATAVKNVHLVTRVRELSMIDPLTRCLMRQFGVEALSRELGRMRRAQSALCVAILDVDNFKQLNDAHGHPTGDRALATVGRLLKEGLRASDIFSRHGGDEFLIVLPETALAGAVQAVNNLRRRIGATEIDTAAGPILLSVSVGVTDVEVSEEDPARAIARADAAMYEAKRAGRDRVAVRLAADPEQPHMPVG